MAITRIKLIKEWTRIINAFSQYGVKPTKYMPNMCELMEKIRDGKIKVDK